MKKLLKNLTSVVLVLAMLLSVLPMGVSATQPAEDEITVYLSLSQDGEFVTSDITGDTMARIPITLSYFDLESYGLEKYNRYETGEEGGEYINDTIVEQPTILHLYIKALETYYLGRTYNKNTDTAAMNPSGEPTSFFMLNFWGNDQNLVYFVNHEYPLMSTGWGATADYVLLEDGMEVSVAMFSGWDFYFTGYFSYFANGDEITVNQGDTVAFEMMGTPTSVIMGGEVEPESLSDDEVAVYYGTDFDNMTPASIDSDGLCSITFAQAGEYYVISRDVNYGTDEAVIAPAVTKVNVTAPSQEETYDVSVHVAPSSANVAFYECAGFDANGYDILGEPISATDSGVDPATSYHEYLLNLPEGTYSFRATDAAGNSLGGMTFDIPSEVEVDNIASHALELYFRQVDLYTTTKINNVFADETQYSTQAIDADGKLATAGQPYLDSSSRTRFPYMLYANGNAELYTFKLIPTQAVSDTYNYGVNTMLNQAISSGTTIYTKSAALPTLIDVVISAPTESRVQVFNQLRNYYTEEITAVSTTDADGISSYTYRLPKSNGNHTYRVSMEGKITKAGYLNLTSADTARTEITFQENEDPKIRPVYDRSTTIGSRMEDNILLNINPQNYLRMAVGDTFKARAYRAWQIINNDTANIMIEPDFEYRIISGDSVSLEPQGQNALLRAVKNGISIIEVTYDAIEIGGNTNYKGIYGATDPMRKGLFVVNVGGNTQTEISLPDWDSDFDTVYFEEDTGTYQIKPLSSEALSVTCNGEAIAANEDDTYTLPIRQGNNIISITAGSTVEYLVIKGNKVTVNIDNVTSPNQPIKQGDTVAITLDGLHMPMPKFSGLYNPGYGGTAKISYIKENGSKAESQGLQYNFISNHSLTMTLYDQGSVSLQNGCISFSSMGSPEGAHRELTDTGIGANFNAVSLSCIHSILPDISFDVLHNDDLSYMDVAREAYCKLSKVSIICGTSTYQKSFMFNFTTESAASKQNNATTFSSINSEFPFTVNVIPVNDVDLEFRYWELGDAQKRTATLTSGETLSLNNTFTGEKPIFMEVAVTPKNPVFGGEKVYSYVAYKSTAGFERPILKTLNVKDAEGSAYALYADTTSGLAYTKTEYTCYLPSNVNTATISLARLNGTANVTVGEETKSVGTSETEFLAIATESDETTVTITVADGASYTLHLIKTDAMIRRSVVNDGEKAAISLISPQDSSLAFYLAAYETNEQQIKRINQVTLLEKELAAGESVVYLDLSAFSDAKNAVLFVCNEDLQPMFEKNNIEWE